MAKDFPGFPREALTFLRQLERNNSRDWFQPRKGLFELRVREPMLRLVERLSEDVRRFAADHVVEPKKALYRIYRDTRFSKDKTPYKTHVAAIFPARGMPKHAGAGFYFHLSPKGVEIAGGMYMPGPPELAAVRRAIADDFDAFAALVRANQTRRIVGELLGERLTRVPKGFQADHPAEAFLRMKQFYFDLSLPPRAATSPALRKQIAAAFRAMAPVVHWLNSACLRAAHEEDGDVEAIPQRPEPMF